MRLNKVEICGVDTSELKTLTEEEKRRLLERVREGDMEAREELTLGNLRLVLSVIRRFSLNVQGSFPSWLYRTY